MGSGTFSLPHLLILGLVILVLFGGKGKISDIMGDFAKGIKSFKKGLADDDTKPAASAPQPLDHRPGVEANQISQSQKAN